MQIIPLGGSGAVRERTATAIALPSAGVPAPTRAGAPLPATLDDTPIGQASRDAASTLPKGALPVWNPARNADVSGAQQALQFLDRLSSRLQNLKSDLGSALAGNAVPAERLEQQRQSLAQLWNARTREAGDRLDGRLVYRAEAPAAQTFRIQGLDAAPTSRETLAITVGTPTPARPAAVVVVEPGLEPKTLARRLDQALAPTGLRAEAAEDGGLRFSVPESQWPAVRDTLAIRGEGRRFPTGPFHRVRAQAEPSAMAPESWTLAPGREGRETLQRIVDAQGRAGQARDAARSVLQQAGRELGGAMAARDAAWAQQTAQRLAAGSGGSAATDAAGTDPRTSYHPVAALDAALPRISRQRILRLLAPDS